MKTYTEFGEGILDLLTKKGREKEAKVKRRLAGVRKTRDQQDKDYEAWKRATSKAAGRGGTKADADKAKELEKLPHVKARITKMRAKYNAPDRSKR